MQSTRSSNACPLLIILMFIVRGICRLVSAYSQYMVLRTIIRPPDIEKTQAEIESCCEKWAGNAGDVHDSSYLCTNAEWCMRKTNNKKMRIRYPLVSEPGQKKVYLATWGSISRTNVPPTCHYNRHNNAASPKVGADLNARAQVKYTQAIHRRWNAVR